MKKLITLSIIATMALSTVAFADTVTPISTIETTNADSEYVPAREYAEGIGYDVTWNDKDRSITFTKGDNTFIATVDSNIYYCDLNVYDPETVELSAPTVIYDDIAYIPKTFAKKLFDVPVVEPMPFVPITPEVPVIDDIISTMPPQLETDVAKEIATVIEDKMLELEKEQLEANEEYKDAYLATGGSLEDYSEPAYEIGYKIQSCDENYTSVEVYRYQTLASSFTEEVFYTFDSKTGEQVSLEDILGEDYEQSVKDTVVETANDRMTQDPDKYNYDKESLDNLVIDEDTSFYIDKDGNIVVSFEKYELAAGSYGSQEFIVGTVK